MVLAPAPTLQFAWRPVRFVFLAKGTGPYTLAVGSPTLRRNEQSIDPELEQVRDRGDDSAPLATLGPRAAAPFVATVAPAPAAEAWRLRLGVALLLGIAGVLAVFALRRRRVANQAV